MPKFIVGDRVNVIGNILNAPDSANIGYIGTIKLIYSSSYSSHNYIGVLYQLDNGRFVYEKDLQLISSSETISEKNNKMNILEKFKLLGLNEPEKTFRILEIQNNKGELTEDGKKLYDAWRFEKDKKEFSTAVAEPLLKEMEANKK